MLLSPMMSRRFHALRKMLVAVGGCALSLGVAHAQSAVAIHAIMTSLPNSPYLGQTVSVSGIVVGVMSSGGFYITAPSTAWDTNAATAEGIEVYAAAGANPACAVVGNSVTVVGVVANGTAVNGAGTPGTGITPTSCTVGGTAAVGTTITLTSASSYAQDLATTGMPAKNTVFYAVAPTSGITDATTGLVSSTGQFWADLAVPTNGHLFKSAGLEADNFYPPAPAPAAPAIATWSGNPQRLLIDTATFGGTPIDIGAGQTLTCAAGLGRTTGATTGIGVIDYSLGYNRLLLFASTTCTISGSIAPSITSPADSQHFHVGTLTLSNFYNASSPGYSTRVAKAALAIVNIFGKPDILSVQEVQDLATLQAIGDAASALAGAGTTYQAYWAAANDATNLSLGFLVNTSTVSVSKIYQVDGNDTFTLLNGTSVPLWERPPYVLEAGLLRAGQNYQVEVVNIETTSRTGIDDPVNGPNVWERRGAQAEELSVFANAEQVRGQNLIIAGEFNAYSFSDGFVDITNVVIGKGFPASGTVAQYEPTATATVMYNFVGSITVSNSTYNVIENGNARSIEHILCSETQSTTAAGSLYSYISFVTQPHWTTDFPAIDANDPTTAAGLTARDGFVGAFLIPPVPTTASLSPTSLDFGSVYRSVSASLPLTFTNTSTFPSTVNVTGLTISGANAADYTATSNSAGGNCTGLSQNAACTITVTFAPTGSGTRVATLTVSSDAGAEPTLTASLTGVGLDTTASLTPTSATYPLTILGTTSAAQTFTWTNTSPVALSVNAVSTTGDYAVASNTCSGSVAAGATCTVSVVFAPVSAGPRTGTLNVASSSTTNPTLTSTLTGSGTANIGVPASLNLGNVDIGATSSALPLIITNYSNHAIALSSPAITGDFSYVSQCPASLPAISQCTVLIAFSPTALGTRTGTFTLASSDPGVPLLATSLTGNGVDFTIAVTPGSGTVIAGLTIAFTATVTPLDGYTNSVAVACAKPANVGGSTCTTSMPNVSISGAPANVNVVVTTTAQYTVISYSGTRLLSMSFAAMLSAWLLRGKRRGMRGLHAMLFALAIVSLGLAVTGCSGKLPNHNVDPTYPGTYTYTVTATDGLLTHSATFNVTAKVK